MMILRIVGIILTVLIVHLFSYVYRGFKKGRLYVTYNPFFPESSMKVIYEIEKGWFMLVAGIYGGLMLLSFILAFVLILD